MKPSWAVRIDLINIQRDIYDENLKKIKRLDLGVKGKGQAEIERYEEEYTASTTRPYAPVPLKDLRAAVRKADIVIVGDYHTLAQSQKTFLKIVRMSRQKNQVIGLEFVLGRHQDAIDRYVAGRITERSFLKRTDYLKNWPYRIWGNFKPIFDFARHNKLRVLGLDCPPEECGVVEGRGSYIALRAVNEVVENPGARFFLLIGELHTAPRHVPSKIATALASKGINKRILIIHQNIENIYWELLNRGLENEVDCVAFSDDRYCLLNTPPIIIQQSYLDFLENEPEEDLIDHRHFKQRAVKIARKIAGFLKIDISDKLSTVQIYPPGDLSFLESLERRYSEEEFLKLKSRLRSGESQFIPAENIIYLAKLSLNHASEEMTHFIKMACTPYSEPERVEDLFYSRIMHEALGFFGSKLINHKRKAPTIEQMKEIVETGAVMGNRATDEEKMKAYLVLRHLNWLKKKDWDIEIIQPFLMHMDSELFYMVTHDIGYMLGEKLYAGMFSGVINREEIRTLFFINFEEPGMAFETYKKLGYLLKKVKITKSL